ncbi:hypothetical protein [Vibrio sp. 1CM8B]|uniref:hypothetical protein n=1 Tax=Vibrio sp. 1CM8B TaxID=2929167 RepID=UPI0020BD69A6|nr:hypothetical protein [Vibrio sp. 1CM8B]MCK8083997.1 hypothetical protein [Vibrio sp. 1CM8B]
MNFLFLCLLVIFSHYAFSAESHLFPLSTQINRANLYEYSISVRLSKEHIVLQYDDDNESFHDGLFLSYVTTTIPINLGESFEYSYNISEFSSSCEINGTGSVIVNDFIDLYIDGVNYQDVNDIKKFSFDADNSTEFERATNVFSLVTNQNISNVQPLTCNGNVTFNMELKL